MNAIGSWRDRERERVRKKERGDRWIDKEIKRNKQANGDRDRKRKTNREWSHHLCTAVMVISLMVMNHRQKGLIQAVCPSANYWFFFQSWKPRVCTYLPVYDDSETAMVSSLPFIPKASIRVECWFVWLLGNPTKQNLTLHDVFQGQWRKNSLPSKAQ